MLPATEEEWGEVGHQLRIEIAKQGRTRNWVCQQAPCNARTLRRLLDGDQVEDGILLRVCQSLRLDLGAMLSRIRQQLGNAVKAPAHLGGYTKEEISDYFGDFLTIRPSFQNPVNIFCWITEVVWNDADGAARCIERNHAPQARSHAGLLSRPRNTPYLYLTTVERGWHRLVLLSGLRGGTDLMRGLLLTLEHKGGVMYRPIACPIVYVKRPDPEHLATGEIRPGDGSYEKYREWLSTTIDRDFAKLLTMS